MITADLTQKEPCQLQQDGLTLARLFLLGFSPGMDLSGQKRGIFSDTRLTFSKADSPNLFGGVTPEPGRGSGSKNNRGVKPNKIARC